MFRKSIFVLILLVWLPSMFTTVNSQRPSSRPGRPGYRSPRATPKNAIPNGEFTFARLKYDSYGWGGWTTDYPKADEQFIFGLRGWVRSIMRISDNPAAVAPTDKELFRYPFVYIVEPGQMELSREDADALREYLLRGGFMMLDDFWGEYEWQHVREQIYKIFPERPIQEIPLNHSIFHCYFDIDEVLQVPNFHNYVNRGRTHEKGGIVPQYLGIMDETDRIMIFIARNADNGDAWEWIDDPEYPLKYGLGAYRLGMNLIFYSMTH